MPVPKGTRFRIRKTKKGYERLAFSKDNKVIERTPMERNKQGKLKKVAGKCEKLGR